MADNDCLFCRILNGEVPSAKVYEDTLRYAFEDINPLRDGNPCPESIAGANRDAQERAVGTEIAYTIVNARTVWDEGAVLGYCTDTRYDPWAGLRHELESYNVMFSTEDIIELMGPNTAAYINMVDELGTLEAGKLADIVLVEGDPMEGYWNMLNAKVVLKEGAIVVDKRDDEAATGR